MRVGMKTIRVAIMLAVSVTQQRVVGAAMARELKKREHRDQVEGEIFFTSFDEELIHEQFQNIVNEKFDVILTMGQTSSLMLRHFYDDYPEPDKLPTGLFAAVKWPIEQGIVDSLKRPGGRITGIMREGSSPFIHARFIAALPFACKRIAIVHSRFGECGYIAGKSCMTQKYLERRGFMVNLYPVESADEVLGTVHQLMRDNKPDMVITFEGCETDHFIGQISDICTANGVHYFGEGHEAVSAGALFGYGGHSAVFAHKAVLLIRKMVTKHLDPATTPVLALPNNRTFFVSQRALDEGLIDQVWLDRIEKRLDTEIIVRKQS